jgi:hypothetical protein
MADRDYSHRSVVDKLGVKPGHAVAFDDRAAAIDQELREQVLARAGRGVAEAGETPDLVLAAVEVGTDAVAVLRHWRGRIRPTGGIWLLTPKRGLPGYVDQRGLISAGQAAGVVENKSSSVSDATSAMRFVIRKSDCSLAN